MKKIIVLLCFCIVAVSCSKETENITGYISTDSGVFIVNEGNFIGGTGTLSFYSYNSSEVYNDLFDKINGWPLGNVAYSMSINDNAAYIVVNNSGKIEVIDKNTLESITTINGLVSPRYFSVVDNSKAYVTSLYSDSVAIISMADQSISGYINLRRTSEAIIITGNKAFVSNWVGGNEIMVINTLTDQVVDSIEVGAEPENIVIDKNNMLWVLCTGGWAMENGVPSKADFSKLVVINTNSNLIEKEFIFPTIESSPLCLQIDGNGETLYYLENGVQRMNIDASELPSTPFITETGHYFYKIGINPVNSDIFLTDAVDFQQPGYILIYNKDADLISTQTVDIIPAYMCFKLNANFLTE